MGRSRQTDKTTHGRRQTSFDLTACISRIIAETVRPDFSKLIDEINKHAFVSMRLDLGTYLGTDVCTCACWGKVLFTLEGCCIIQEVQRSYDVDNNRFKVYKVGFGSEWDRKFVEYIDSDHHRYDDVVMCWDDGAEMYST